MTPASQSVQRYWADQLDLLLVLREQVRDREPDAIHDIRAAGRRLKATVRVLRPLIKRRLARELLDALDWYNGVLGHARDAEVIHDGTAEYLDQRPGSRAVLASLEAERSRTAHIADNLLTSAGADAVITLVRSLVDDPWRGSRRRAGQGPSLDKIMRRVRWAEERVAKEWRRGPARGEEDFEWQHRLRRRAKAARYIHEAVSEAVAEAKHSASAYAHLATLLGVIQDRVIITRGLAAWPRELVSDVLDAWDAKAEAVVPELPAAVHAALPAELMGRQGRLAAQRD